MKRIRHPAASAPQSRTQRAAAPCSALQRAAADSPSTRRLQSLQHLAETYVAPVQRMAFEEEEPLQAKSDGPLALIQRQAEGGGLPLGLRNGIEALSGVSMAGVRVHYNSPRPAQLTAHAFAQGSDIHLAPGQERHLPHEAWHVVQQRQGRVRPTTSINGEAVNDQPALETEADTMGTRASQRRDPSP